jgi:hypothetical protein
LQKNVFSIQKETFRKAKLWVKDAKRYLSSSVPITVVGNKSDMATGSGCVDQLEAQEWAAESGVTLFEISARNGSKLLDVFYSIGRRLRASESMLDHPISSSIPNAAYDDFDTFQKDILSNRTNDLEDRLWSRGRESTRRPLESKRSFDLDVDISDRHQQQTRKGELRRSNSIERSISREGQYQDDYSIGKPSTGTNRPSNYRSDYDTNRSFNVDSYYSSNAYDSKATELDLLSHKKMMESEKLMASKRSKDLDELLAEYSGRSKDELGSTREHTSRSRPMDSLLDNLDRSKSNRYRSSGIDRTDHLNATDKHISDSLLDFDYEPKEPTNARSWTGKSELTGESRALTNGRHEEDLVDAVSRSNRLTRRYSERALLDDRDANAGKSDEPWSSRADQQIRSAPTATRSIRRADSLDTKKAVAVASGRLDKSNEASFSLKELDKLMAKLEQDNKVLAELDRKFNNLQQREPSSSSVYKTNANLSHSITLTSHLNNSLPALTHTVNSGPTSGGRSATALGSASNAAAAAAAAAATKECHLQLALAEHVIDKIDIANRGRCRVYIARYSYDPFKQSPNEHPEAELHLNAGDFILVTGEVDQDGFFMGELLDGRKGLVPSNFVEKLTGEDLFEFQASVLYGHKADSFLDESASLRMGLMSGSGGPGSLTGSATGNHLFPPEFYDALLSDAMQHTNFQHLLAPGNPRQSLFS